MRNLCGTLKRISRRITPTPNSSHRDRRAFSCLPALLTTAVVGTLRTTTLTIGTLAALSACGHALPDDPFDGEGTALSMVPINHTDRYAVNIFLDKYWAGDVSSHGGGGKITCCYPGLNDWREPVTVRWTWGWEEDPKTKAMTVPDESHTAVAHFPGEGPHNDPDPYKADAYACVIFRDLNTVELAFSPSASGCADK